MSQQTLLPLLLTALLATSACNDDDATSGAPVAGSFLLESGTYEITAEKIASNSCTGMVSEDNSVGQRSHFEVQGTQLTIDNGLTFSISGNTVVGEYKYDQDLSEAGFDCVLQIKHAWKGEVVADNKINFLGSTTIGGRGSQCSSAVGLQQLPCEAVTQRTMERISAE